MLAFFACSNLQAKKLFVEMEFHKNSIKLDDGSNKKRQALSSNITASRGYVGAYGGASSTNTKVYYIFSKDVSDEELEQVVNNSYKDE